MFDGQIAPNYVDGISATTPTVILIEGLPFVHTQSGAWVGWTTRFLPATRFKIEGYDAYSTPNTWRVIADYSATDYYSNNFSVQIPVAGVYTKLKFTFYKGISTNEGTFGVSELFFIHPEATTPYEGLLSPSLNNWKNNGKNLAYNAGKVGIGTNSPTNKLDVNGTIHSREVKVDVTGWPDYVFKKEYNLPALEDVEKHIKEKGYLQNIPSEEEVIKNGVNLGEMNVKLLDKIEELTLYMIEINKKVNKLEVRDDTLSKENTMLGKKIDKLR